MRTQAKDMSFYGIVDDIKYNSSLAPYEFVYKKIFVNCKNKLHIFPNQIA